MAPRRRRKGSSGFSMVAPELAYCVTPMPVTVLRSSRRSAPVCRQQCRSDCRRNRRGHYQGDRLVPPIYIAYLNRLDIEELGITDDEILSAIEASLASQGRGET